MKSYERKYIFVRKYISHNRKKLWFEKNRYACIFNISNVLYVHVYNVSTKDHEPLIIAFYWPSDIVG